MRTFSRSLAFAVALALSAPAVPVFAQPAQPTKAQQQEAATRFKKGLDLFKDGDYQAALIEFRRANELAPNFNVLYNIGQVYFQLQDYPNALTALERYLNEGADKIPTSRRADVIRDIDKLKARVANVEITTTVPDADISIDDVPVGKSPLAKPVMVSAGKHKITVAKVGFTAATKIVEVASGDSPKILVEPIEQKTATPVAPLTPVPLAPVEPPPPPVDNTPLPPPVPPSRPAPVAGIVVTSILAVGAVVTGSLALVSSSGVKSDLASGSITHDQLSSDATKTTALAVATDVMTGGAIIALGVTLYVGLRNPPAATPAAKTGLKDLRFGLTPNGARVIGAF